MSESVKIDLRGWELVHTWHESHGCQIDYIYQQRQQRIDHRTLLMTVSRFPDSQRPDMVSTEYSWRDYLRAKEILANPEEWEEINKVISPCATASTRHFQSKSDKGIWAVTGVAGHGSWAQFLLDPLPELGNDLSAYTDEAL